jgi:tetratricopeptide (TPR) repeat protein/uncharacterized protein YegL
MRLDISLRLGLLVPLILGLVIVIIVSVVPYSQEIPKWVDQNKKFTKTMTDTATSATVFNMGRQIDEYFIHVSNDMTTLHSYAKGVLSDQLPVKQYFRTYSAQTWIDPITPEKDKDGITFASTVFKLAIGNYSDLLNLENVNKSSLVDSGFRSVFKSNNLFVKVYIGLNNGVFRRFPYANLNHYETLAYKCEQNQQNVVGYDPRCRIWYVQSQSSESIKFTPPYKDAFSGKIHISLSKGIFVNNVIKAVISGDFSMERIDTLVHTARILHNGYTFLMDRSGLAIAHPNIDRTVQTQLIGQLEPFISTQILSNMMQYTDINPKTITFSKNDKIWYATFVNIPSANYILVSTYPESDTYIDAVEAFDSITRTLNANIIVLVIVFVFLVIGLSVFIYKYSGKYTRMLKKFSQLLVKISEGDLNVDLGNEKADSLEMQQLSTGLSNLLTAVRFGNTAYYAGNLNKSLEQYQVALELMRQRQNHRGIGVCYNNMGNVYKQLNRPEEARRYFLAAIDNAKEYVTTATENKDNEAIMKANIMYANRLMNLGVLCKDTGHLSEALTNFDLSFQIHKKYDNPLGMAKVSGNIGQVHIANGKFVDAQRIIETSYNIIRTKNDLISKQYSIMNMGIVNFHRMQYQDAVFWLTQVLRDFQEIDEYTKSTTVHYMKESLTKLGRVEEAKQFHAKTSGGKKTVIFTLDVSGSMEGPPIETCRKSIQDIIDTILDEEDQVALIAFHNQVFEVIPMSVIKTHKQYIHQKINDDTKTGGQTAFYDALKVSVNKFIQNNTLNNKTDWVVALTDGDDNASATKPAELVNLVSKFNANLVVITVGNLANAATIKQICDAAPYHTHIRVGENDIRLAFQKVAGMISGQLNVEQL